MNPVLRSSLETILQHQAVTWQWGSAPPLRASVPILARPCKDAQKLHTKMTAVDLNKRALVFHYLYLLCICVQFATASSRHNT